MVPLNRSFHLVACHFLLLAVATMKVPCFPALRLVNGFSTAPRRTLAFQQQQRYLTSSATAGGLLGRHPILQSSSFHNNLCSAPPSRNPVVRSWSVSLGATTKRKNSSAAATQASNRPYYLVIVESPSKCKTISKILNEYVQENNLDYDYVVASSMGHVRDLPKNKKEDPAASLNTKISGINIHNRYEATYITMKGKEAVVKELSSLASKAEMIVMATDEDREGEAIAWHLSQLLTNQKTTNTEHDGSIPQVRVTFAEITPSAIRAAVESPRDLDLHLVEAQETRRILDRLAGFTISPILWKKIAPGLSAGRVQSVGMALIVEREKERLLFKSADYWDLKASLATQDDDTTTTTMFNATMVSLNGKSLATGSDFDNTGTLQKKDKQHLTKAETEELLNSMTGIGSDSSSTVGDPNFSEWKVVSVKSKERSSSPPVPFTTSTLQQESNKRLGMSVSQTMSTAQSLYEAGVISYMRTDSTHLSNDAHNAIERSVTMNHGASMVAPKKDASKAKKKKAKNVQEAHEAIRPAIQGDGAFLMPEELKTSPSAVKLYELIFQRTLASRMPPQVVNITSIEVEGKVPHTDTVTLFRTSGSVVLRPGYTLAWGRSTTDSNLPPLVEGQILDCQDLSGISHTTQPPARYTEASFVKELETLGVGRPSTYASTVKVLRDRAYVGTPVRADDYGQQRRGNRKELTGSAISAQRAAGGEEFTGAGRGPLVPSLSAFVVHSLLEKHCPSYIDPNFTAGMEERLDKIARGDENEDRVAYLDEFYAGDDGLAAKVQRIDENVNGDEARRANLPTLSLPSTRKDAEKKDDIGLFIGPWGPYVQKLMADPGTKPPTAPLPPGMAADITTITPDTLRVLLSTKEGDGVLLGTHPDDERDVRLKVGRFGAYLQWGADGAEGTSTHSLPKNIGGMRNIDYDAVAASNSDDPGFSLSSMIGLSWEDALGYVSLPRTICEMNDLPITAAIGPYGPYLKYNNTYASLHKNEGDVLYVDAETAQQIVTDKIINKSSKLSRGTLADLGEMEGSKILVKEGRFGIYLNWKRVNAKMPSEYLDTPEDVPLDLAWNLIQEKASSPTKKKKGKTKESSLNLPPKPKRPLSAYLHFCAEHRADVAAKIKSLGDISKELARLWAETDPQNGSDNAGRRQKYEDLAAEGKVAYTEKLKEWEEECNTIRQDAGVKTKKKSKVKGSTSNLPKKPLSAYLYFCADKRPQVKEKVKTLGEISKELAKIWADTDEQARIPYQNLAAADKVRYQEELQNGVTGAVPPTTAAAAAKRLPKTTKKKKKKTATKRKTTKSAKTKTKRAPSAYMLFCSDHRQTIVDDNGHKLPLGETTKQLAKLWKECDAQTRSQYEEKAQLEKQLLQVPF